MKIKTICILTFFLLLCNTIKIFGQTVETYTYLDDDGEWVVEEVEEFEFNLFPPTLFTHHEINMLGNLLYGAARGVKDKNQQAAVIWCVLNRLDHGLWGDTIEKVLTSPYQFPAYNPNRQYSEQDLLILNDCNILAEDVLYRYALEKIGLTNVGRTLPQDYLYFYGKHGVNYFPKQWRNYNTHWNWSLENPY